MKKIQKNWKSVREYFYKNFWQENRGLMMLLLVVLLLVVFVRMRLIAVPFDRDEGEYAYMGQLILQGHLPYEEAYNLKLPGTYFAFAAIMLVFGQSLIAIHFGLLLTVLATGLFMLLFLKNFTNAKISIIATIFFLLMSTSYSLQGPFARAEHFVIFFALGGFWILSEGFKGNNKKLFFLGGMFLSLAFLMKQHGIFLTLFGLIYFFYNLYLCFMQKKISQKETRNNAVLFLAGLALPVSTLVLAYLFKGEFQLLWHWTFAYAREHLSIMSPRFGFEYFWGNFSLISRIHIFQATLFLAGLLFMIIRIKKNENRLLLIFVVLSFSCTVPGFYFSKYYFVMFLPGFCLLSAWGAFHLAKIIFQKENLAKSLFAIVLVAILYPIIIQADYLFSYSNKQVSRLVFGYNPFPEALVVADYLQKNTDPSDKIAVLGSEPEIFFYSKRKSATGFLYMYTLMDDHKFATQMQWQMIQEVESSSPKFVVFISRETSWRHSWGVGEIILNWYPNFLKEKYEVVGVIDYYSPEKTEYVWGEEAANYKIKSKKIIWIYERKNL